MYVQNVHVHKYEKSKFDQPFLSFKPKHLYIGKSKVCAMTEMFGAGDETDFDGNTLLLEFKDNEYVYISGIEILKFKTDDKTIDYISPMGNNMCPYAIMIGQKYTSFIDQNYKVIGNNKIQEGTLLNARNDTVDPFEYHLEKFGIDSFEKIEPSLIQTFHPHNDEDDIDILKCVVCRT